MTHQEYVKAQFKLAIKAQDVRVVLFPDQEMTCVIVIPAERDEPILFHMQAGSDDDEFYFVSATHAPVRFSIGDEHPRSC